MTGNPPTCSISKNLESATIFSSSRQLRCHIHPSSSAGTFTRRSNARGLGGVERSHTSASNATAPDPSDLAVISNTSAAAELVKRVTPARGSARVSKETVRAFTTEPCTMRIPRTSAPPPRHGQTMGVIFATPSGTRNGNLSVVHLPLTSSESWNFT